MRQNRQLAREQQTRITDLSIRQAVYSARLNYADDVMNGRQPMPAPGTAEAKNLASIASFAAHGQADPRFEAAFSRYWYHFKDAQQESEENDEIFSQEDDFEDSDGEELHSRR